MLISTVATGFRWVRFIKPLYHYSQPCRLLAYTAGELSMWPLADLLVGLASQADASLNIAYIPYRDTAHPFTMTEVHDLARRLMQNIALLPVHLRAELRLALH